MRNKCCFAGGVDVTAFICSGQTSEWYVAVNAALCRIATGPPKPLEGTRLSASEGHVAATTPSPRLHSVRNVTFINADTKVVRCLVDNVEVAISANQVGAVSTVSLLESLDRWVGRNHLFKRSLLLIKVRLALPLTPRAVLTCRGFSSGLGEA